MLSAKVLSILEKPKNVGQMRDSDAIGKTKGSENCNDFSKIFVKFENGKISETRFQTYGGPISIAAVSVISELIKGKTIEEVLAITEKEVLAELGNVDKEDMACVENALAILPSLAAKVEQKQAKEEKTSKKTTATKKAEKTVAQKKEKKAEEKPAKVVATKEERKAEPVVVEEKKEESKPVTTTTQVFVLHPETSEVVEVPQGLELEEQTKDTVEAIASSTDSGEVDVDIFSEIDEITAKISKAVEKMKKDKKEN